jgi:hypothetical protein
LLELSGRSALAQTVREIEVFVVLDGADGATRAAARRLAATDARVRVFDNPKGERVGEVHRDTALREAVGTHVAYLSDDDLWLPFHLQTMADALGSADFVAADTVFHNPDGTFDVRAGDVGDPHCRARLLAEPRWNFVGLSQGAHTMSSYRSLERGWQPAPAGIWSDLHMWREFLRTPGLVATSTGRTSVFTFPSPRRREMTLVEREAEMARWLEVVLDPSLLSDFLQVSIGPRVRMLATESMVGQWKLETELEAALVELDSARDQVDSLESELGAVRSSVPIRAARRIAAIPVVGHLSRRLARLIAGRRAPDDKP